MTLVDWAQLGINVATGGVLAYLSYCVMDTHWRIARLERLISNSERGVGMLLSVLAGLANRIEHQEQEQEEKDQ